eukprot:gene6996-14226_t
MDSFNSKFRKFLCIKKSAKKLIKEVSPTSEEQHDIEVRYDKMVFFSKTSTEKDNPSRSVADTQRFDFDECFTNITNPDEEEKTSADNSLVEGVKRTIIFGINSVICLYGQNELDNTSLLFSNFAHKKSTPGLLDLLFSNIFTTLEKDFIDEENILRLSYSVKLKCYEVLGSTMKDLFKKKMKRDRTSMFPQQHHEINIEIIKTFTTKCIHNKDMGISYIKEAFLDLTGAVLIPSTVSKYIEPKDIPILGTLGHIFILIEIEQILLNLKTNQIFLRNSQLDIINLASTDTLQALKLSKNVFSYNALGIATVKEFLHMGINFDKSIKRPISYLKYLNSKVTIDVWCSQQLSKHTQRKNERLYCIACKALPILYRVIHEFKRQQILLISNKTSTKSFPWRTSVIVPYEDSLLTKCLKPYLQSNWTFNFITTIITDHITTEDILKLSAEFDKLSSIVHKNETSLNLLSMLCMVTEHKRRRNLTEYIENEDIFLNAKTFSQSEFRGEDTIDKRSFLIYLKDIQNLLSKSHLFISNNININTTRTSDKNEFPNEFHHNSTPNDMTVFPQPLLSTSALKPLAYPMPISTTGLECGDMSPFDDSIRGDGDGGLDVEEAQFRVSATDLNVIMEEFGESSDLLERGMSSNSDGMNNMKITYVKTSFRTNKIITTTHESYENDENDDEHISEESLLVPLLVIPVSETSAKSDVLHKENGDNMIIPNGNKNDDANILLCKVRKESKDNIKLKMKYDYNDTDNDYLHNDNDTETNHGLGSDSDGASLVDMGTIIEEDSRDNMSSSNIGSPNIPIMNKHQHHQHQHHAMEPPVMVTLLHRKRTGEDMDQEKRENTTELLQHQKNETYHTMLDSFSALDDEFLEQMKTYGISSLLLFPEREQQQQQQQQQQQGKVGEGGGEVIREQRGLSRRRSVIRKHGNKQLHNTDTTIDNINVTEDQDQTAVINGGGHGDISSSADHPNGFAFYRFGIAVNKQIHKIPTEFPETRLFRAAPLPPGFPETDTSISTSTLKGSFCNGAFGVISIKDIKEVKLTEDITNKLIPEEEASVSMSNSNSPSPKVLCSPEYYNCSKDDIDEDKEFCYKHGKNFTPPSPVKTVSKVIVAIPALKRTGSESGSEGTMNKFRRSRGKGKGKGKESSSNHHKREEKEQLEKEISSKTEKTSQEKAIIEQEKTAEKIVPHRRASERTVATAAAAAASSVHESVMIIPVFIPSKLRMKLMKTQETSKISRELLRQSQSAAVLEEEKRYHQQQQHQQQRPFSASGYKTRAIATTVKEKSIHIRKSTNRQVPTFNIRCSTNEQQQQQMGMDMNMDLDEYGATSLFAVLGRNNRASQSQSPKGRPRSPQPSPPRQTYAANNNTNHANSTRPQSAPMIRNFLDSSIEQDQQQQDTDTTTTTADVLPIPKPESHTGTGAGAARTIPSNRKSSVDSAVSDASNANTNTNANKNKNSPRLSLHSLNDSSFTSLIVDSDSDNMMGATMSSTPFMPTRGLQRASSVSHLHKGNTQSHRPFHSNPQPTTTREPSLLELKKSASSTSDSRHMPPKSKSQWHMDVNDNSNINNNNDNNGNIGINESNKRRTSYSTELKKSPSFKAMSKSGSGSGSGSELHRTSSVASLHSTPYINNDERTGNVNGNVIPVVVVEEGGDGGDDHRKKTSTRVIRAGLPITAVLSEVRKVTVVTDTDTDKVKDGGIELRNNAGSRHRSKKKHQVEAEYDSDPDLAPSSPIQDVPIYRPVLHGVIALAPLTMSMKNNLESKEVKENQDNKDISIGLDKKNTAGAAPNAATATPYNLDTVSSKNKMNTNYRRVRTSVDEKERKEKQDLIAARLFQKFLTAVGKDRVEEAETLVMRNKSLLNIKSRFGRDALQIAVRNGCLAMVEMLMRCGASLDTKGPTGDSLVHIASGHGHVNTLLWLISKGLAADAVDMYGQNAVHAAARACEINSLKLLYSIAGHCFETKDLLDMTPSDYIPIDSLNDVKETVEFMKKALHASRKHKGKSIQNP